MIYAPLGDTPVDPDVVLISGRPAALMRLLECALRAGIQSQVPFLGRPTCMALPVALSHGVVASMGCIGNRVYTDLGDDELYVAVPGRDLAKLVEVARDHRHGQRRAVRLPPRTTPGSRDGVASGAGGCASESTSAARRSRPSPSIATGREHGRRRVPDSPRSVRGDPRRDHDAGRGTRARGRRAGARRDRDARGDVARHRAREERQQHLAQRPAASPGPRAPAPPAPPLRERRELLRALRGARRRRRGSPGRLRGHPRHRDRRRHRRRRARSSRVRTRSPASGATIRSPGRAPASGPGPSCYCGRTGCIETFLSGTRNRSRPPRGHRGGACDAATIAARAADGDERCEATLARYEERLARALAAVVNVLDPDVIVLGGGLSNLTRLYETVPARWGAWVFSDRVDTRAPAAAPWRLERRPGRGVALGPGRGRPNASTLAASCLSPGRLARSAGRSDGLTSGRSRRRARRWSGRSRRAR